MYYVVVGHTQSFYENSTTKNPLKEGMFWNLNSIIVSKFDSVSCIQKSITQYLCGLLGNSVVRLSYVNINNFIYFRNGEQEICSNTILWISQSFYIVLHSSNIQKQERNILRPRINPNITKVENAQGIIKTKEVTSFWLRSLGGPQKMPRGMIAIYHLKLC